ncbi:MAG TPA: elongation factor G [Acidimicrobiales bacterium]|nr:elongation factor G [Acidimicrobiales bacterium]
MALLAPSDIRNVALVGHHAAGKTTLAEALLLSTGALSRPGSVDKGTTVCDFEAEEISRQLSVSFAIAPCTVDGVKVNLLDTPGYADFATDMRDALGVADLAVVVVSATDGVQAQTEDAWRAAAALGLPRIIVIDKLDRERADFDRTLAEVRAAFGAGVAPVELPIGAETEFRGVIDLLDDRATLYDTKAVPPLKGVEGPIPDELAVTEHTVHEQLVEGIVVGDDDLTARYLDGEPIERGELQASLASGVASGAVFPVLCCSGTSGVGVDRLARLLVELCPSPDHGRPAVVSAGGTTTEVAPDSSAPPLLVVCKTLSDQHAGRLSLCKVLSGTLKPDTVLTNPRTHTDERLHVLSMLRGHETSPVDAVGAGDFVAIPRLTGSLTGDTLAPKDKPVTVSFGAAETPALAVAVAPASRADEDKLMSALQRLCEEDRSLSVSRNDEAHQTVLGISGEVHFAVTLERLSRKFGVSVERQEVAIPYRETISKSAAAEGKHKKQSGGHGQFGVCHLRVEPLERGEGFQFHDEVVGGAIPRQYIPAVEKGVVEAMARGGAFGHPVVDVSVTVDDGKYHSVDSSELSFKTAAALAFREAVAHAGPILLEPVSKVVVQVPADLQGDVLGDLNSRRGRIVGTEVTNDGLQEVTAMVPTAELARYAVDLRALTGGRGRFRAEHDHFDPVPEHLVAGLARSIASE